MFLWTPPDRLGSAYQGMHNNIWWFKRSSWVHLAARWVMLIATVSYVFLPTSVVWANPTGEQVVGGAATFQRGGNKLTVNQTTDRVAINWQSFSIGAGEHTHFNMPSAASVALNRVLGGNPSDIRGTLTGQGMIIVANPFGISTAPGSLIKTGSFIGTTRDINPDEFMNADFSRGINLHGDSTAPILNAGTITAEKGDVFLIAQKVENRGTISAPNGTAALVGTGRAEDKTEVVLYEKGGAGFAVRVAQLEGEAARGSNHGLPDGEELLNEGVISAAQAELSASGNVYALAIKNSGTVRAKAVIAQADGSVRLDGGLGDVINSGGIYASNLGNEATADGGKIEVTGQNVTTSPESIITAAGGEMGGDGGGVKIDAVGTTMVQGKVDVSAPGAGAKGGKAEILGDRVGLFDGAKVDASGGAGGGTVLVGGDYLGGRASGDLPDRVKLEDGPVKNATATVMANTAEIRADANQEGDGGKIILWSDEYTAFYGQLLARGGVAGGDGGFIETSSLVNLQVGGSAQAQSFFGRSGLWLLDPLNVSITSAANFGGSYTPGTPDAWRPDTVNSNVDVAVILASLTAGNDVLISTFGSQTGGQTGIVEEPGVILVGADINDLNATGSLTLRADSAVDVQGTINIQGSVTILAIGANILLTDSVTSLSGNVSMNANTGIESSSLIRAAAGNVSLATTTGNISLDGAVTADAGTVNLSADGGQVLVRGSVDSGGSTSLSGATGVTVQAPINTGNATLNISSGLAGDILVQSTLRAGTINLTAGADGDAASILLNAAADVEATTAINLNSDNDISIAEGGVLYLNNPLARFNLRADNGNVDGGGTVRSGFGEFLINAGGGVDLVLQSDTGTVTVDASATTGNLKIASNNDITLTTIDTPFSLDAPSEDGDPTTPLGDIEISTIGVLDMGGTSIIGGRNVSLSAGSQIILNGSIQVGGVLGLVAPAVDIAPEGIGINFFTGGDPGGARGAILTSPLNSLDPDPANAAAFVVDLVLDNNEQAILELGGLVGADRPLASFSSYGGLIRFLAPGASAETPSIAVVNPGNFPASGFLNFDSTNLQLFQDTYLRSQGDMIFGGTVTTGIFVGQRFADRFSRFDLATRWPGEGEGAPRPTDGTWGGQIVFNGTLGSELAPLGKVVVVAQGVRPVDPEDPECTTLKDAQISLNAGIITYPGVNPLNPGSDGLVDLKADGAIVIISTINTAGGVTTGQNTIIGGNVCIHSDLDGDGQVNGNENIQLGGDTAASIRTRGGKIDFNGDVYLVQTADLNTTAGNSGGSIMFNGKFDGVAPLVLDAGIAPISFKDLVGSLTPAGLTITASGGIDFDKEVIMGGAYILAAEGAGIVFNGTVNGRQALTVNSQTGDIRFVEEIGDATPIASLTVGPGGLGEPDSEGIRDRVYFGGDITTQGIAGTPSSSFITISKDAVVTKGGTIVGADAFTLKTNARETVTGGTISFLGTLAPEAEGATDLVIEAGSGGNVVFNGNVGSFNKNYVKNGPQFGRIAIKSASGVGMGDGVVVYADGRDGSGQETTISIDAALSSFFPQGTLTFWTGKGHIAIPRGGDLSGVIAGQGNNTAGSKLLAKVDGAFGNITVGGLLNVSGGDNDVTGTGSNAGGPGFNSGFVFLHTANGYVEVGSIAANGGASQSFGSGGNGLPFGGVTGDELGRIGLSNQTSSAGAINLFGKNVIVNGALLSNGGAGTTSIGGTGGGIQINLLGTPVELTPGAVWKQTRASFSAGSIYANGGGSQGLVGGDGGSVRIKAAEGFLVAPTTFQLAGGVGANNNVLLAGRGGSVTISANSATGDIFFDNTQFNLTGNGSVQLEAGKNLALQYKKFSAQTDGEGKVESFSEKVFGGVVISINQVGTGQTLRQTQRGLLSLLFAQSANGDYQYDLANSSLSAGLYLPSNAYILSNGGDVQIKGGSDSTAGNAVISGITTSGGDVNGGNIVIENTVIGDLGDILLGSALETFGGTPVLPTYGRSGGSVEISGGNLNLRRIDTRGSDSLATATAPAIGGGGGDITLRASLGRAITLKRDLLTSGGQGLGVGDATGGGGGSVTLVGNVILATGEPDRPDVMIDTTGGLGRGDGEAGQGGAISWNGGGGSVLQGTANSNALDLRYGSGTVTLGTDATDTLILGELITAADDARSTGTLRVKAKMDTVETLTTYARGYNLELLGGGTVETPTTFLNTGYVQFGQDAGTVTTFSSGLNTQNNPSVTLLAGKLQTSDEFIDSEASILLGSVQLRGNSSLDTFGNTLVLGSVDSITTPFDLELLAGIGNGTIQLGGNFGGNAGKPSALADGTVLVRPGAIKIDAGLVRAEPIVFPGTFQVGSIVSLSGTALEFRQDVRLSSGSSTINGQVILNNTLVATQPANVLDFDLKAESDLTPGIPTVTLNGSVLLQGGAISMVGKGNLTVTGSVSGGQNLTVGGSVGSRVFAGSVNVGTLILKEGATKDFNSTLTASTITQTGGEVSFFGGVTTQGASSFAGTASLSGMTFTAGGSATFAIMDLDGGSVTLAGAGTYTVNTLNGNGTALTLGGTSGSTKNFLGDVDDLGRVTLLGGSGAAQFLGDVMAAGFTQNSRAGSLSFAQTVLTTDTSSFNGPVVLGTQFNSDFSTTFAQGGTVQLGSDLVLMGDGAFSFLTSLQGQGFDLTMTGSASLALGAGGTGLKAFTAMDGATSVGGTFSVNSFTQNAGTTLSMSGTTTINGGAGTALFNGGTAAFSGFRLNGGANIQGTSVTSAGTTTVAGLVSLGGTGNLTSSGGVLTLASGLDLQKDYVLTGNGGYSVGGEVTAPGVALGLSGSGAKSFAADVGADTARLTTFTQTGGRVTLAGGVYAGDIININGLTVSGSAARLDTTSASADGIVLGSGGVQGTGNLALFADGVSLVGLVANNGTFSATRNGNLALGGAYLSVGEVALIQSSRGAIFTSEAGMVSSGNGVRTSGNLTLISQKNDPGNIVVSMNGTTVGGALAITAQDGTVAFSAPTSTTRSLSLDAQAVTGLEFIRTGIFGRINIAASSTDPVVYGTTGDLILNSGTLDFGTSTLVLASASGTIISNAGNVNPFGAGTDVTIYSYSLFNPQLQGAFIPGATYVRGSPKGGLGELGLMTTGAGSLTVYYDNLDNFLPYTSQFTTGTGQPYVLATQNEIPAVATPERMNFAGGFASRPAYTEDEIDMMTPAERSAFEADRRQQAERVILERQGGQVPQAKASGEGEERTPTAQAIPENRPLAEKAPVFPRDSTQIFRLRPGKAVATWEAPGAVQQVLESDRMAAEVHMGSAPVAER